MARGTVAMSSLSRKASCASIWTLKADVVVPKRAKWTPLDLVWPKHPKLRHLELRHSNKQLE